MGIRERKGEGGEEGSDKREGIGRKERRENEKREREREREKEKRGGGGGVMYLTLKKYDCAILHSQTQNMEDAKPVSD